MNIKMQYTEALQLFQEAGENGFIKHFNELYSFDLYAVSTAWIDNSEYVCKLKGVQGDILLMWT